MTLKNALILLVSLTTNWSSCSGQNFKYKPVPSHYIPKTKSSYLKEIESFKGVSVGLIKYLGSNPIEDGSVDYTKELQKGIDLNAVVQMPNFPVAVTGLKLRTNSTIIFQKNSKLLMLPSKSTRYDVLKIEEVHDVNVYYANIIGERNAHLDNAGEWGFGISILSAYNVKIISPTVINCWGDGIYIDNMSFKLNLKLDAYKNNNVMIDGAYLDNNRRNGLSLIDGNGITIRNSTLSNTNGTAPMAGIDVEPDNGDGQVRNILLDKVTTFNNQSWGILVVLGNFKSEKKKNVSVTVNSCADDGSEYGMGFANGQSEKDDQIFADGFINITNHTFKDNKKGTLWLPFYGSKNTVRLSIKNPKVYKDKKLITSAIEPTNATNTPLISIK